MKIVYLENAPVPAPAAYSVHTLHTVAAMGAAGHDVTLVAPAHAGRIRGRKAFTELCQRAGLSGPFRLRYLPIVRPERPHLYFGLASVTARLLGADLVFTRNQRLAEWAARLGCRVLIEFHDVPTTDRGRRHTRALIDNPHVVRWVFVSERLRQIMARDLPLPLERSVVAHNGVALELYRERPTPAEARRALGLPTTGPLIVHSGHMYSGRGIELLYDLAARLSDGHVVLVGGNERDIARVRREVADRRLKNVAVIGHRPIVELPRYLAAADVLVMPYTSDTVTIDSKIRSIEFASPMKTFEYLAAGRPIVATRFPALSEVLHHDENAILVEPDSADALRAGVAALLADPARAARLAARARTDAETRSWGHRTERILAGL